MEQMNKRVKVELINWYLLISVWQRNYFELLQGNEGIEEHLIHK